MIRERAERPSERCDVVKNREKVVSATFWIRRFFTVLAEAVVVIAAAQLIQDIPRVLCKRGSYLGTDRGRHL